MNSARTQPKSLISKTMLLESRRKEGTQQLNGSKAALDNERNAAHGSRRQRELQPDCAERELRCRQPQTEQRAYEAR